MPADLPEAVPADLPEAVPADLPEAVDVAVIGGGPAGCAAALCLRRYTDLAVALIERDGHDRQRIGESLSPGILPLLDYLGVGQDFRTQGHRPSHAFTAVWGDDRVMTRDFLFTGRGHGWHLDRGRFDTWLARSAAGLGTHMVTQARVGRVGPTDGGWAVVLDEGGMRRTLKARYVIDATGRTARIGVGLGARLRRYDTLVGVAAYLDPGGGHTASTVLVEAVPDGWWYTAPLPDGRMIAAFMSDADIIRRGGLHRAEAWRAALDRAPHTAARTGGGTAGPPRAWPARSQTLEPACGIGWAAAGDAAAAFDPLSSMGIGYAVTSGIHAARLAASHIRGTDPQAARDAARTYAADIQRHMDEYLALRSAYYRAETRFADRIFWRRRAGPSSAVGHAA